MKVLLHDDTPAYLCHGGKQVQASRLYESLKHLGVEVEYAHWWDADQRCDVIHSLGCSPWLVSMAQEAGVKIVLTHLVPHVSNSSHLVRMWHRTRNSTVRRIAPQTARRYFLWSVLPDIDELVYVNTADAETAHRIYGVPRDRISVIPHGCSSIELARLQAGPHAHSSYLVCLGSIIPVKNSVMLARAARRARVPVVFMGKPFNENDSYYEEFNALVDGQRVIYPGHVSTEERISWMVGASGFVHVSRWESGSLAVSEAAAAGLPMLLADRPWAREYAVNPSVYLVEPREDVLAARLKSFFDSSCRMVGCTFPVSSWDDIARKYMAVYERAVATQVDSR